MSASAWGACLGRAVVARPTALSFPQKLILAFALAIGVPLSGYAILMYAINAAQMDMIGDEALDQRLTIAGQFLDTTGLGLLSIASTAAPRLQDSELLESPEATWSSMLEDLQRLHGLAMAALCGPEGQFAMASGDDTGLEARLARSAVALNATAGQRSWTLMGNGDSLLVVAAAPASGTQSEASPGPAVVVAKALSRGVLQRLMGNESGAVEVRELSAAQRAEYEDAISGAAEVRDFAGFRQVSLPSAKLDDALGRLVLLDGRSEDAGSAALNVTVKRSGLPGAAPRFGTVAFCAFAFSLLLAALLASMVTTWVSRPLEDLQERVQAFTDGEDQPRPLEMRGDDAIGRLAQAFNRMLAERAATQARILHNERLAMAGKMSAAIAHEVKNVLAPIHLRAEMVLQTATDPLIRENLEGMRSEVDRSAALLRNLLELSRGAEAEYRAVLIGETARRAVQLAMPQAAKVGVRVVVEDGAPGALVWGDQAELLQIVVNLLNNAVEAGARNIVVRTELVDGQIELVVRDDGMGMDPAVRDRALEPFFTTKPSGKGTGLGLSICHSVVRAHRGTIGIESCRHGGTRVAISLPSIGDN